MSINKTITVVPTYDNPLTIKDVARDVLQYKDVVMIVDDGSAQVIEELFEENEKNGIIFLRHDVNQGKGAAIVTGASKAKELGYTHIVTLDGDGQHLASEIQKLEDSIDDEKNEIIIGYRDFGIDNIPFGSKFGRWFSNFWATWDTGYTIEDSLSGFRIYPVNILELDIKTQRFDWEMEVLVRHADSGYPIREVVIDCYYPTAEDRVSHFKKFGDTMAIVWVHIQILPFKWVRWLNPFSKK